MTAPLTLSPFEERLAARLPEGALRELVTTRGLPHRRVEEWKWSDLRSVVARFEAGPGDLHLDASREADAEAVIEREPQLLMPRLAAALGGAAKVFTLADGETLTLSTHAAGAAHGVAVIDLPAGRAATLVERHGAAPGAVANLALLIRIGEGARLDRIVEQAASPEAAIVVTSGMELARSARARQTTLGFGARLARLETHVEHAGEGAQLALDGAYLLGAGLHLDQTTQVRHTGPHGVTTQLFKGAAAGGGKGVFQGKIHVEKAAQKTDAKMNHRGLLLADGAEIDSKPELEIYADDVACAHGNALGAIDANALFYMRQRGLPEPAARALLTESFLAEPLEAVSDERLREGLLAGLRDVLGGLS